MAVTHHNADFRITPVFRRMRLQVKLCNMWDLHKFTEFRVTCDNRESRKSTIAEAMVGLKKLENMASDWGITAIVSADRRGIVIEWGDAHRPINVLSARKSILSGLLRGDICRKAQRQ
jgi:hypothetical protein